MHACMYKWGHCEWRRRVRVRGRERERAHGHACVCGCRYAYFENALALAVLVFGFWKEEGSVFGREAQYGRGTFAIGWLLLDCVLLLLLHSSMFLLPLYALTAAAAEFSNPEHVLQFARERGIREDLVSFLEATESQVTVRPALRSIARFACMHGHALLLGRPCASTYMQPSHCFSRQSLTTVRRHGSIWMVCGTRGRRAVTGCTRVGWRAVHQSPAGLLSTRKNDRTVDARETVCWMNPLHAWCCCVDRAVCACMQTGAGWAAQLLDLRLLVSAQHSTGA